MVSRRTFLKGSAGVAGGVLLAASASSADAGPLLGRELHSGLVVTDLEVVTVTPTSITFTWATYEGPHTALGPLTPTIPANTEVRMAEATQREQKMRRVYFDATPRGYHHATVTGLKPGTTYRFACYSNGQQAEPGLFTTNRPDQPEYTGVCTTLVPPPGRHLITLALLNDTHVGEERHGLIVGDFPRPITQKPGRPPFTEVMLAGAIKEIKARRIPAMFVNGDTTSEARPAEIHTFRKLMDTFGGYQKNWWVTRGNHDRPHKPEADPDAGYDKYPVLAGTEDHRDPWGQMFIPRQQMWVTHVGPIRVIGLDSTKLDASGGEIAESQFATLERELSRHRRTPTLVMAHHPVTRESAVTNAAGPTFVLNTADAGRLQNMMAEVPGIFMMHAGHTHRIKRTCPDTAKHVDFVELGAAAGYPGGYTLLHVFSGGYMMNFHRTSTPLALEWTSRSRWVAYGLNSEYLVGDAADRNYVVRRKMV